MIANPGACYCSGDSYPGTGWDWFLEQSHSLWTVVRAQTRYRWRPPPDGLKPAHWPGLSPHILLKYLRTYGGFSLPEYAKATCWLKFVILLCIVIDLVSLPKLFIGLTESILLPLLLLFPRKQQSQSSSGAEGALPLSWCISSQQRPWNLSVLEL